MARTLWLGSLAVVLASSLVIAQEPELLLMDGDPVILMGAVERIESAQINDGGVWTALVDTDNADINRDFAILRNGFVTLREGTALFAPENTVLDEFISISLAETGHLGLCLRVNGQRDALYWNTVPIALKDTPLLSPLVDPDTNWERFSVVRMNGANEVFVMGTVDNPGVAGAFDPALCKFTLDGTGNILATEVLLTRGQGIAALDGSTVNELSQLENAFAINARGDFITLVRAIGTNAILINAEEVVAREAFPSPVPGRNWQTLVNTPKVWINDRGEYLFTGSLGGTDGYLIVKSGEKFAQAGDLIPTFSASPLFNAGTAAPLFVTNDGNVFWRAESTAQNDDAFLRNYTPFLRQGQAFAGDVVLGIEQTDNAFAASRNGRFFAGRVDLQAGGEALVAVDFGLILPLPGCAGNVPELAVEDGLALPGQTLRFAMDRGNAPGALAFILFATRERIPGSECGANTPYGELLISNAHRVGRLTLPPWNGTDASTLSVPVPPDLSLVDQTFFAQGVFHAPAATPAFALTNGLRIEIGAP